MSYKLSPAAERDLQSLYLNGVENFGTIQADTFLELLLQTFDLLAENPRISRLRAEYEPPVRIHPCPPYVIVYLDDGNGIWIIRIRHGREDWQED